VPTIIHSCLLLFTRAYYYSLVPTIIALCQLHNGSFEERILLVRTFLIFEKYSCVAVYALIHSHFIGQTLNRFRFVGAGKAEFSDPIRHVMSL